MDEPGTLDKPPEAEGAPRPAGTAAAPALAWLTPQPARDAHAQSLSGKMSEVPCRLPRALGVLSTRRWPWPAVRVCEVAPAPAAERAGSCPSARASVSLARGDRLTLRPVDVKPRTRLRVHAAAVDRALARVPGRVGRGRYWADSDTPPVPGLGAVLAETRGAKPE